MKYFLITKVTEVNKKTSGQQTRSSLRISNGTVSCEGKKAPIYEGILIFDEVQLQSKVGCYLG